MGLAKQLPCPYLLVCILCNLISALPPYIKQSDRVTDTSIDLSQHYINYTNLCQYWPGTSILTYKSNMSSILTYKSTWNQHAYVHPYMWTRLQILIKQVQCTKQVRCRVHGIYTNSKTLGLFVVPLLCSGHYWEPFRFLNLHRSLGPVI